MKVALGHDGPPRMMWRQNLLSGKPLARCPLRDMLEAPAAMLDELTRHRDVLLPHYKAGHLLARGGIAEQPARYLDFMTELMAIERTSQALFHESPDGDED